MKKVLFLHGFFASGSCVPAKALRDGMEGKAVVLTPDLPLHPDDALHLIRSVIETEKPDLLVGNSCGSFYAQMLASGFRLPALLGNPYFEMSKFLKERIGAHQYKSPRSDGIQNFVIDDMLISEFAKLERNQFDGCTPESKDLVWGLFGEHDALAHYEPLFLEHYSHSYHFPGGHTPTEKEVRAWYIPLAERMLSAILQ